MDLMQDWPEPVVPVQSLSESGAAVIPSRYVKPLPLRPSPSTITDHDIPVVDLNDGGGGDNTIKEISSACREWGFFQAVNHGIDPGLIRRAREMWREFFHLPMKEKVKYANSPRTYEGYGSRVGVEKGAVLDWGDYYFLRIFPKRNRCHNKWPSRPTSCRNEIEEYCGEVLELSKTLMKMLSAGLGLEDEEALLSAVGGDEAEVCLRANLYPKCPQPEFTLGLSAHSDPGTLTILNADEHVKGLQVRRGDGWVNVQPVPGALIVNVGDQLQVLSNAAYKSVEHRVTANSSEERLSIAFFYNPKGDLLIRPAPELLTPEKPPIYLPMTFNEYRIYIRANGPQGKFQLESLKLK